MVSIQNILEAKKDSRKLKREDGRLMNGIAEKTRIITEGRGDIPKRGVGCLSKENSELCRAAHRSKNKGGKEF